MSSTATTFWRPLRYCCSFSLHGAFVNPALVRRLTPLDRGGRADLIGGIHREQTRVLVVGACLALGTTSVLWLVGVIGSELAPLILTTIVAGSRSQRNFYRMTLVALQRPQDVLRTDICYVILLIAGTVVAVRSPRPAAATLAAMSIAALVAGVLTARALWSDLPRHPRGSPGILRAIAPLAALSTAGAAIHWSFSQGFMYLAAVCAMSPPLRLWRVRDY